MKNQYLLKGDRFVNVNISSSVQERRFWYPYKILDKGLLEVSRSSLKFQGQLEFFEIDKIRQLKLIRAHFRWWDYISVLSFMLLVLLLGVISAWYTGINNEAGVIFIIIGVFFAGVITYSFFIVVIYILDQWILVEYIDEMGKTKEVYMSHWGNFGIFSNNTTNIFKKIHDYPMLIEDD